MDFLRKAEKQMNAVHSTLRGAITQQSQGLAKLRQQEQVFTRFLGQWVQLKSSGPID